MAEPFELPYASEAEQYVLGCLLWGGKRTSDGLAYLRADDFFDPRHRAVFEAIEALFLDLGEVSPILVVDRLRRLGKQATGVSTSFLADLLEKSGAGSDLKAYAELLGHRRRSRELQQLLSDKTEGFSDEEINSALTKAEDLLYRMTVGYEEPSSEIGKHLAADLEDIEERGKTGRLRGVSTGLDRLDGVTNGWRPQQLIIVGGRPGMGKSALMSQFALACARDGGKVLYFTLEMSPGELRERMLVQVSGVNLSSLTSGQMTVEDWARLAAASEKLKDCHIEISPQMGLTVAGIAAEARRFVTRNKGLDLVIVDYLQLIEPLDGKVGRVEQVSQISRALKLLAGQMNVPVIVGSQLNRGLESRVDKTPGLADLRDSGSLEQDADVVLFLYRNYLYDNTSDAEEAELIIGKQRQGEAGIKLDLRFTGSRTLFSERGKYMFGGPEPGAPI